MASCATATVADEASSSSSSSSASTSYGTYQGKSSVNSTEHISTSTPLKSVHRVPLPTREQGLLVIRIAASTDAKDAATYLRQALLEEGEALLRFSGHGPTAVAVTCLTLTQHHLADSKKALKFYIDRKEVPTRFHGRSHRYDVRVRIEDHQESIVSGVVTKVRDSTRDRKQYKRQQRHMLQEEAHDMADIIFSALLSGNKDVVMMAHSQQVVTFFEAAALAERRLKYEGHKKMVECRCYFETHLINDPFRRLFVFYLVGVDRTNGLTVKKRGHKSGGSRGGQ